MSAPREEIFDLVDGEGRVVGRAERSRCHGDPSLLHPVVHALILNGTGELLLQKRHPQKRIQPDRWDTSVGGHVESGEALETALLREIEEEIGLRVALEDCTFCYRYRMTNEIESELVHTWTLRSDGPFRAQPGEVSELRFWSFGEIDRALGSGVLSPNFEEEYGYFRAWLNSDAEKEAAP